MGRGQMGQYSTGGTMGNATGVGGGALGQYSAGGTGLLGTADPSGGTGLLGTADPSGGGTVGGPTGVGGTPALTPSRGGTAGEAIGVGEAQVGKPHVEGADGPDSFSCTGLIRYILRNVGVDANAPWSPEGYLATYQAVDPANLQPGDVVIYPSWATMYVGNGMLLNSNAALGSVTNTPMSEAGTPEGIVRPPYGG